jgi:hypothetical protein
MGWFVVPDAAIGIESMHYEEHENVPGAPIFDQQDETTTLVTAGVTARSPHDRWFVRAMGHSQYTGQTQDGAPLAGNSEVSMIDLEADGGIREELAPWLSLSEFVGFGYRRWNRDTRDVPGGNREVYIDGHYVLGVAADARVTRIVNVGLELAMIPPAILVPEPIAHLDISHTGVFDDITLPLLTDAGITARLRADYAIADGWRATAMVGIVTTQINNSPARQVTVGGQPGVDGNGQPFTINEPFSTMRRVQATVGVAYRW